ncbi:MAG: hypothetical protein ACRDO9_11080, partial [Gaiellales bacterium]
MNTATSLSPSLLTRLGWLAGAGDSHGAFRSSGLTTSVGSLCFGTPVPSSSLACAGEAEIAATASPRAPTLMMNRFLRPCLPPS